MPGGDRVGQQSVEALGPLGFLARVHGPWASMWALVRPDRALVGLAAVYALGSGLVALALPLAVQSLINTIAFEAMWQPVVALAFGLLMAMAFMGLMQAMQFWVAELAQRRLLVRVGADLAARLPQVRAEAFDGAHGPELANRFFAVFGAQKAVGILLVDGAGVVAQTAVGLSLVALYHPALLGLDLLVLLAAAFIVFVLGRQAGPTTVAESDAKYALAAWLEELARSPWAVGSPHAGTAALVRADRLMTGYLSARSAHFSVLMRQLLGFLGLQASATALIFAVGGSLVAQRELGLGQLVAAELILAGVLAGLVKWVKHLEAAYDLAASAVKLGHLVHLPLQPDSGEAWLPEQGPGRLELEGLVVGRAEGKRLAVDLALAPGQHVGLDGPMGVGLTTLAETVAGWRAPLAGRVRLDGVDAKGVSPSHWQAQVKLVRGQEVLAGRVLDALRWHDPELSLEEAERALARVGLAGRVASWPEGLATRLAPTGAPLSSGETALLGLASAMVAHPKVLILDGLLDTLPEPEAQHLLGLLIERNAPWTLVLISRRPSLLAAMPLRVRLGDA